MDDILKARIQGVALGVLLFAVIGAAYVMASGKLSPESLKGDIRSAQKIDSKQMDQKESTEKTAKDEEGDKSESSKPATMASHEQGIDNCQNILKDPSIGTLVYQSDFQPVPISSGISAADFLIIDQPGEYYLAEDIEGRIEIDADNVYLNLCEHTLQDAQYAEKPLSFGPNDPYDPSHYTLIQVMSHTNVQVTNGILGKAFHHATAENSQQLQFDYLTFTDGINELLPRPYPANTIVPHRLTILYSGDVNVENNRFEHTNFGVQAYVHGKSRIANNKFILDECMTDQSTGQCMQSRSHLAVDVRLPSTTQTADLRVDRNTIAFTSNVPDHLRFGISVAANQFAMASITNNEIIEAFYGVIFEGRAQIDDNKMTGFGGGAGVRTFSVTSWLSINGTINNNTFKNFTNAISAPNAYPPVNYASLVYYNNDHCQIPTLVSIPTSYSSAGGNWNDISTAAGFCP